MYAFVTAATVVFFTVNGCYDALVTTVAKIHNDLAHSQGCDDSQQSDDRSSEYRSSHNSDYLMQSHATFQLQ